MALQMAFTVEAPDDGQPTVLYPAAYVRVFYVRATAQESYLLVCWYADADARERNDAPFKQLEYQVATSALVGDVYPAAYAYLKTLPEFAGAIDC